MDNEIRTIYVDLDETLVRIDLLRTQFFSALRRNPLMLFTILAWFVRGGLVGLKLEMAHAYPVIAAQLPYNQELLTYLKKQRDSGLMLVLATAAPAPWARCVADFIALFDRVLATDETNGNLKGRRKLAAILKDCGGKPFAYAGDAMADRPIFEASNLPIVVGNDASLAGKQADKAIVIS
jgi:hydroxymethylpyrimidine pyrophosphatase-like HAD family hydrolase